MKTWLIILIILAAVITLSPFVVYGIALINEGINLRAWRKSINKGMTVLVDDGQRIFKAQVAGRYHGSVKVITENEQVSAYGEGCIFPLNYLIDENDIQNENSAQEK